jgi:adenosylhomocysteine nucleosidase
MIGIMSAMREEIEGLLAEMKVTAVGRAGRRDYHRGTLWGTPAVVVFSRWGKVAAATTATSLIEQFGVTRLLFTGVAGALDESLRVGDVVVASRLFQHDSNASPFFHLRGVAGFGTDSDLRQASLAAAETFLRHHLTARVAAALRREFRITQPQVSVGQIASSDRFFTGRGERAELEKSLPGVACVEMEGAAVAQVCHEHKVPFVVIRTISDAADEGAAVDCGRFLRHVAGAYAHGILRNLLAATARALAERN